MKHEKWNSFILKCKIGNVTLPGSFWFVDRKAHRNGIKKPKRYRHESTLGVRFKFIK